MPLIRHSVKDSIPNFVEYNYELFVEMMELYYEHLLEQSDAKQLLDTHGYILADDTTDDYIARLQDELGLDIPIHESITNKSLITHYLNVILSKRGSEAGLRAFFKLAFNESVIVNYPYRLLFIPSITKHDTLRSCLLSSTTKPSSTYYSIKGFSSGVDGDIETVSTFEKNGLYYLYVEFHTNDVLKLDERVDLIGESTLSCINTGVFVPNIKNSGKLYKVGDVISFTDCVVQGEFEVVQLETDGISVNIDDGGIGYAVSDIIMSSPNNGFFSKVDSVDVNGTITAIKVTSRGSGFIDTPVLKITSKNGSGAILRAFSQSSGGVKKIKVTQPALLPLSDDYKAYTANGVMLDVELERVPQTTHSNFVNNNHKTAINNFILDSNNIHNHSYNIITSLDLKYWKSYVDKYFHRSGYVYKHVSPMTVKTQSKINGKYTTKVIE